MIRAATNTDLGRIAYMLLQWDEELPSWLRRIRGNAKYAEWAAKLMLDNPRFVVRLLEQNKAVVGASLLYQAQSILAAEPYWQLLGIYIKPNQRGTKLLGVRLLKDAIEIAQSSGLSHLEISPWADNSNYHRLLERLGGYEVTKVYVLPFTKECKPCQECLVAEM